MPISKLVSPCAPAAGGLGTLGLLVTGWLQQQSVAHIHLLGRSALAAPGAALAITSSSCSAVTVSKADLSLAEDLGAALAGSERSGRHVHAVLHASGVLADATLARQTLAGIRAAYAPKALPVEGWGGRLRMQPAALQLLFSSLAAQLGAPGQANYAAANAVLDSSALAAQQQVRLLPCRCDASMPRKIGA